jgi:hypothetical protein
MGHAVEPVWLLDRLCSRPMDVILVTAGALAVLGFLVAVGRSIACWRGYWRSLAVVVLLGAASWAIKIGVDLQRDPTSHNLWPFEAVIAAGLALVLLGAVAFTRVRVRPSR